MTTLLSIDPGRMSGLVLGDFTETRGFTRWDAWQVSGGLMGLIGWMEHNTTALEIADVTICEKFTPLNNAGFSHTLKSVEPLRIEGGLIALGAMPDYLPEHYDLWPRPAALYFLGGANKVEKLKRSRAWLKEHGLLLTGKDVGQPDADDAISATLHAFAYLIRQRHRPTLEHYKIGAQE